MLDLKTMGFRIRAARENLGYTREQLAELVNVTPRFFYDIESGTKGVSLDTLKNISDALHVSVDYLLSVETGDAEKYALFHALMQQCPDQYLNGLQKLMQAYVEAVSGAAEKTPS